MKTYAYELSPEDQKRLFFGTWYRDPRLRYRRLLAGPACLTLGVLCVVFQVGWIYVAVGIGLVLVGLYYLFQPLIVFRGSGRSGLVASMAVAGDELRYEDSKSKTVIPRRMITSLSVRGGYLALGVKADRPIYLFFDLGRISDGEDFLDKLRRMAGKQAL